MIEHYDIIEVVDRRERESDRFGSMLHVSYVVRDSSTSLRVGYPGTVVIRPSLQPVRKPHEMLWSAKIGQRFNARWVEYPKTDAGVTSLMLDALWEGCS